jgi:predicted alpha-1,2-mannosidase
MRFNFALKRFCRKTFFPAPFVAMVFLCFGTSSTPAVEPANLVDPFIGTAGGGDVFPGADMPAGMMQWSPDTTTGPGGYRWKDNVISRGFSLTHFSGRGCSAYQDFPFMPVVGDLTVSPVNAPEAYGMPFSHTNESASPGYYQVMMDNGVNVELSVNLRSGMGRFTYPASTQANMLINLNGSANGNSKSQVSIIDSNQIAGQTTSTIGCGSSHYKIYFAAQFNRPFTGFGVWNGDTLAAGARTNNDEATAAYVTFDTTKDPVVLMRIGISYVSASNARLNLNTEMNAENPGWNFDMVRGEASNAWNKVLGRIEVTGGTSDEQRVFYTALYHSYMHPNIFSDVNGEYLGFDGVVHTATNYVQYENFPCWDMYRSLIQLKALLTPKETGDMMQSLVNDALQGGGAMPRWEQINYNSAGMVGDSPAIVAANAYAYGATNFDVKSALAAADYAASTVGAKSTKLLAREHLQDYLTKGYVGKTESHTADHGLGVGVAVTLEYASDDFALGQLALALGDTNKYLEYRIRSGNWENVFNPTSHWVQARDPDGIWNPDFKLTTSLVESDSYQYTWLVPYNIRGLFDAIGGDAVVVRRLDKHFTKLNQGPTSLYAWMGNEPEEEVPWEYDFAKAPWRTQDVVRRIIRELFKTSPDGLPGNDDGGAISSWAVWGMIGMFPEIPGVGGFVLGSPVFSSVTLRPENGHEIHIIGINAADTDQYVNSLKLNGQPTSQLWLPASVILGEPDTTLEFTLTNTPNVNWGNADSDAPPSFPDRQ